ncbi:response regulator receiver domain-containing protein [Rhizobium sp. PP-F2F-G20b]|nr:response regulator receiver domain-containing protein [Rhizobium sp. PP-F2F-G20b]
MTHSKILVLVVEDEPLVRMGIVDYLEDVGFTVLEAGNADEAITVLMSNLDVRIMFTDVDMPGGMDGLRLAAAVRERWPPIKIIVTSGHRKVNVDDIPAQAEFFPKPYDPEAISHALTRLCAA